MNRRLKSAEGGKPAILGGTPIRKMGFAPHPVMGAEETSRVMKVLSSGQLSGFIANASAAFAGGGEVRELERLFCRYLDVPHAVAMNSATSALHAALLAAGVGPGDEVIVPPYTMSASASAIIMCGAVPVFCDVEADYYCLDPAQIEKCITRRTRAILVVHLFGHAADMTRILRIARRHRLRVVEDCAQAPGALWRKRYVGTLGDIGVFSLNQHKTITTGEGGVAVTRHPKLALKMQLVRNHGEVVADHLPQAAGMDVLGWNYRMTELHAAVAIGQFKRLDRLNGHRIRLAEYLNRRLNGLPGLRLPRTAAGAKHVYFVYPIRYDERAFGLPRPLLIRALSAEGIPFGAGYVRPIYLEPMYRRGRVFERSRFPFDFGRKTPARYPKGLCPRTEALHAKGLILTALCRYPLTTRDMQDVVDAFHKIHAWAPEILRAQSPK
ncbi:MAG: DegT/DnrJ/EryC1/StrS family aminotransferase [Candidatus Omnitrophica bacterium]|nr:DegT/DnrJ/EryC1/StrS family aminotransferase [Candidatus Omnitrophota bacterium]